MPADLVRTVAPTAELVTLDQVKSDLRMDGIDDHDVRLAADLATALGHLDGSKGVLGRALAQQTWKLYLDAFPCAPIRLPLPPLLSVGSIRYREAVAGVDTLLSAALYHVLDGERAEIWPAYGEVWPATYLDPRAVTVTFTCGWAAPAAGDPWPSELAPAIAAVKMITGALYRGQADWRTTLPLRDLLEPLRIRKT